MEKTAPFFKHMKRLWVSRTFVVTIERNGVESFKVVPTAVFDKSKDFVVVENMIGHEESRFDLVSGMAPVYVERWWILETWHNSALEFLKIPKNPFRTKEEWKALSFQRGGASAVRSIDGVYGLFTAIHLATHLGWKHSEDKVPKAAPMVGKVLLEFQPEKGLVPPPKP